MGMDKMDFGFKVTGSRCVVVIFLIFVRVRDVLLWLFSLNVIKRLFVGLVGGVMTMRL